MTNFKIGFVCNLLHIVTDTLSIEENDIHFTSLYGEIWRDLSGPGSFRGNSSGKKGNKKGLFTQREWP